VIRFGYYGRDDFEPAAKENFRDSKESGEGFPSPGDDCFLRTEQPLSLEAFVFGATQVRGQQLLFVVVLSFVFASFSTS